MMLCEETLDSANCFLTKQGNGQKIKKQNLDVSERFTFAN